MGAAQALCESALKVDSRRKIPCHTRELNLHQQHAKPDAEQLSAIRTLQAIVIMYTGIVACL